MLSTSLQYLVNITNLEEERGASREDRLARSGHAAWGFQSASLFIEMQYDLFYAGLYALLFLVVPGFRDIV